MYSSLIPFLVSHRYSQTAAPNVVHHLLVTEYSHAPQILLFPADCFETVDGISRVRTSGADIHNQALLELAAARFQEELLKSLTESSTRDCVFDYVRHVGTAQRIQCRIKRGNLSQSSAVASSTLSLRTRIDSIFVRSMLTQAVRPPPTSDRNFVALRPKGRAAPS